MNYQFGLTKVGYTELDKKDYKAMDGAMYLAITNTYYIIFCPLQQQVA